MDKNFIPLKPCPYCKGEIRIYTQLGRGAFAKCKACKKEFDVCEDDQIPTYHGVRIRKSTVNKVYKMWNKMALNICANLTPNKN